ncbi:hypothetical protein RhiirA5_413296 [Rhizophagus irregularis]|uniref:Uncharacterized protein n=1 Tax=Rhizophagus irregularis TaxID=588596 RepID=A0A2I1EZT2_9GLOM|nr:hypothetical protein RhiirA5_413296 [Rhizophagus irregularis]PKC67716.1 hypothetical protein RhiirA1_534702 [Rhizophagus irregularis]PKC69065.1 hypothetical protein RhiirA1_533703 [Rhizophagus irregularis]PKY27641.1 hypothetical protein RhiirB3_443427 [Rhizophagus irregularis]
MIILLVTSSTPIRRQDALSGFKSCKDNFPNCEATIHIAGKATVIIENGALYKITGFDENIQIFHHEISFCEAIVTLSGFSCPVKENFDLPQILWKYHLLMTPKIL